MRRASMRPAGRLLEVLPLIKTAPKMYSIGERTKKWRKNLRGKKRGAYNFLQSLKWGPFWQRAAEKPQNGATLELRGGGGRRGWRGRKGGGGEAKDKEAGES